MFKYTLYAHMRQPIRSKNMGARCNFEDLVLQKSRDPTQHILASIYLHRRTEPSGRNSSANGTKHTTLGRSRLVVSLRQNLHSSKGHD